jgi:hypothetical protein
VRTLLARCRIRRGASSDAEQISGATRSWVVMPPAANATGNRPKRIVQPILGQRSTTRSPRSRRGTRQARNTMPVCPAAFVNFGSRSGADACSASIESRQRESGGRRRIQVWARGHRPSPPLRSGRLVHAATVAPPRLHSLLRENASPPRQGALAARTIADERSSATGFVVTKGLPRGAAAAVGPRRSCCGQVPRPRTIVVHSNAVHTRSIEVSETSGTPKFSPISPIGPTSGMEAPVKSSPSLTACQSAERRPLECSASVIGEPAAERRTDPVGVRRRRLTQSV